MAIHSTPVFLLGESHGQRSLAGYSPWDGKSRTQLSDYTTTTRRQIQVKPKEVLGEEKESGTCKDKIHKVVKVPVRIIIDSDASQGLFVLKES